MIIDIINKEWGWLNIKAQEVIDENAFGNLIFRCEDGSYWRIIPENPECIKIGNDQNEFKKLQKDDEFQFDWDMTDLVITAERKLGILEKGRKYCLKVPAFLGGLYDEENLVTTSQIEQIGFSGNIARQIHDLPDGAQIELQIG